MMKKSQDYKSPLRKLVKFFEESRNQWKDKYMTNQTRLKQLQNRVRYLEKTKSEWKQKAIALKAEVNRLQSNEKIKVKPTETVKKNAIDKTLVLKGKNDFDTIPFHHKYSIGHVMLLLSFVLTAASSMRGAVRNLEVVKTFFQLSLPIPSWYCIRLWLQRVGYYKLNRAKELANDWVWIVDHTIQLGSEKAFLWNTPLQFATTRTMPQT